MSIVSHPTCFFYFYCYLKLRKKDLKLKKKVQTCWLLTFWLLLTVLCLSPKLADVYTPDCHCSCANSDGVLVFVGANVVVVSFQCTPALRLKVGDRWKNKEKKNKLFFRAAVYYMEESGVIILLRPRGGGRGEGLLKQNKMMISMSMII